MRWSLPIGRLFGVQVRIHATFPLLLLYVAAQTLSTTHDINGAWRMVLLTLLMFGCVLLHEFGHVLAARQFGCQTRDVTLLPIGGVASLESIPEKPLQELWVAVAGPLVNVVIAAILLPIAGLHATMSSAEAMDTVYGNLPAALLAANLFMVLFNLLPAFPMDGGRMLRALLAMVIGRVRATQVAARIGQVMAVLFCLASFKTSPTLAIIGVMVWIGASREALAVTSRAALDSVRVRSAMLTDFRSLSPFDTLAETVQRVVAGVQKDFPVVNQGHLLGLLTHGDLVNALASQRGDALVSEVMDQDFPTAAPEESLHVVLARTASAGYQPTIIPVIESDQLVGLLTMDNIGEFLVIRDAMNRHAPPVLPPNWGAARRS